MTTATSGKEEAILVLELVWRSCTFWRSIHIHINHSKLLIIQVHKIILVVSEAGLGRTLVFFWTVRSFGVLGCPVGKNKNKNFSAEMKV